jgi:predicted nucleotidyltransferase component of viral defense system
MLQKQTIEPATLELLNSLMEKSYLKDFVLVGGTALALQIGHRISVDLDLFTNNPFNTSELKSNLEDDFKSFRIDLERSNTLITQIQHIKVDFISFKYGFKYPHIIENKIRIANIKDIAAMKIDAITGRGKKKDFYDLFFLLQLFPMIELLDLYQAKYQHTTLFHVIKSIGYFAEAEVQPDPIVFDKKITWTKVKKKILEEVRNL